MSNISIEETKKIKKTIDKFEKSGNIQKAIETCKDAISKDSSNTDLHIKLGDLYMEWHLDIYQLKQYVDEAITEYQLALESCMDSAEIYYKIATAFYYKRELDKAVNYYKLAIEHNPKLSDAYYMLAEISVRKGDFVDAIEEAKNSIAASPMSSSRAYFLLYNLENILKRNNAFIRLKNLLKSAATLPFDKFARQAVKRRLSYFKFLPELLKVSIKILIKGFSEEVLNDYRKIIDKAPGFAELYVDLGRILFELKRYDDAICEYKMAIWLDSLNIDAYSFICYVYEEQQDYANAIEYCKKLVEMQPHVAEFRCRLAQYLYLQNEVDEAVDNYQAAVTLNPNPQWTSVVSQTLGFIFQEHTKDLDASISSYQNAYMLNPKDIDICMNLGSVFFEKGAYDNALTVYKKALETSPYSARLHCNLGYLYWGKGNIEEAIKEYEKAILYDNTYDIAYNNLGVIYLDDLGRVKKAIELFEAAKRSNPNYALANYNLARSVAITGDKVEAAKLYQAALDINNYTQEMDPIEIEEKIRDLFD